MRISRVYFGDTYDVAAAAREFVLKNVEGGTILEADGVWKGQTECSFVVEIFDDEEAAVRLASQLKQLYRQQSVPVVSWDAELTEPT